MSKTISKSIKAFEKTKRREKIEKLVNGYYMTDEYITGNPAKKIWFVLLYGIIFNHKGELWFDAFKQLWCYTDGKTKVYMKDRYKEKGPAFTDCLTKALTYEADHPEKCAPQKNEDSEYDNQL